MQQNSSGRSLGIGSWLPPALCAALTWGLVVAESVTPATDNVRQATSKPEAGRSEAEIRFQRGLKLAAANQSDAAIRIFSALTVDYPLLPQPYVQLAALYVQQGKLTKAVASLRGALDHQLDDGGLQETLGDLYVELARQSYRNALEAVSPGPNAAGKYTTLQSLGLPPGSRSSVKP
jgi:Tfp pilus assembly protein PilF